MKICFAVFFLAFFASSVFASDFSAKLSEADKLKYAERYEEAIYIYDQILRESPSNEAALKGKDDCRVMLSPVIPEQHLMVPFIDPGQMELSKKFSEAKTPWDKRRAELALERYAVKYTGEMFGKSSKDAKNKADAIVNGALNAVKLAADPKEACLKAEKELNALQESEDRKWKGHGPQILETSLNRLDRLYLERGYARPYDALSVSFSSSPKRLKKDTVATVEVTVGNISDKPVILIDLALDDLRHSSFAWQRPGYGALEYDADRDVYVYNPIAQQETCSYFNNGFLFPGQKISFAKRMRVPGPRPFATVRFAPVDGNLMKKIYVMGPVLDEYISADMEKVKKAIEKRPLKIEESIFPSKTSILFIDDGVKLTRQKFILK